MKQFNKKILLFAFCMVFLAFGFTGAFFEGIKTEFCKLRSGILYGDPDSVSSFINQVENLSTKELRYHDRMLDLESVKKNLLGTRVVETEDALVVKADSERLFEPYLEADKAAIWEKVDKIRQIQQFAEESGAGFLYCMAPWAGSYEEGPANVPNATREYQTVMTQELSQRGIPYLDFSAVFQKMKLDPEEMFFRTDHHWKPAAGFAAYQAICEELDERYSFSAEKEYLRPDNYDIRTYKDWFLGAYGKKAGRFFTWSGADDFDVITPKFRTSLTETVSIREEAKTGSFAEVMLDQEKLKKDFYHVNTYAAYGGGDFRQQVIRNNMLPKGETVLVVRDSFACAVTPFLALQTGELHVIDDRPGEYPVGEQVDLRSYICDLKPDYVIVLKAF